jgi:hypothetical protein
MSLVVKIVVKNGYLSVPPNGAQAGSSCPVRGLVEMAILVALVDTRWNRSVAEPEKESTSGVKLCIIFGKV